MKKTITPGQISRTNLELIYHYIYQKGPVSQQDIVYDLRLSRPTVASKINDLEAMGFIKKDGQITPVLSPDHQFSSSEHIMIMGHTKDIAKIL